MVTAGIIERDGHILICQRHHAGKLPLKWEFPGGKVEPGESGVACLQRELREELSVEADIGELLTDFVYTYAELPRSVHLFFYRVNAYRGELKNNVFEQIKWVTRPELTAYDFLEADVKLVRQLSLNEKIEL